MKTIRYTEAQIIAILRQAEGGVPVAELCREHGMSNASFYKWRAKYGGMDASLISQMKAVDFHPELTRVTMLPTMPRLPGLAADVGTVGQASPEAKKGSGGSQWPF